MKNFIIKDLCLKYIPLSGYTATPLNQSIKLRKIIYSFSPKLYSVIQFCYASYGTLIRDIFSLRKMKWKRNNKRNPIVLEQNIIKHIEDLENNGYTIIDNFISSDECDKIVLEMNENFERSNFDRAGYTSDTFPTLQGLTYSEVESIGERMSVKNPFINISSFYKIAFNKKILMIVYNYLKQVPSTSYLAQRAFILNKFLQSSGWHKDSYTGDIVQFFLYLQDTDINTGALHYLPKSHKNNLKDFNVLYNYEKNVNKDDGRISDDEMNKPFNSNEIKKVYVPKGTAVMMNGKGFHKGPIWEHRNSKQNKNRDVLHVSFTTRTLTSDLISKNAKKDNNMTLNQYNELDYFQKMFTENFNII